MKKLLTTALCVLTMNGLIHAQGQPVNAGKIEKQTPIVASLPVFNWEKTVFNLGKIPQGKPVSMTFSFTNTGNSPLLITDVKPGCGCTLTDFTKELIAPGKKGVVVLTYNAAATGNFTKSATVTANTEPELTVLTFSGEVLPEKPIEGK